MTPEILDWKSSPYKSEEEYLFALWLDDVAKHGYIKEYKYEESSWSLSPKDTFFYKKRLKTKIKIVERSLIQSHEYGCDFTITWHDDALGIFFEVPTVNVVSKDVPFWGHVTNNCSEFTSYVEVKPDWDKNNMTRAFKINQKWMWMQKKIFVNLVTPHKGNTCLFAKTFTFDRYRWTDKGTKKRKIHYPVKTIDEYVKEVSSTIS